MSIIDDRYFRFPIRIYQVSGKDIIKKINEQLGREEENPEEEETEEEDAFGWVLGWVRIPYNDIVKASWIDNHFKKQQPKTIAENGFDSTLIIFPNREEYASTWNREKFEKNLEAFLQKYEEKFGGFKINT